MIEDVKWLKPDDYAVKSGNQVCWLSFGGIVLAGYMVRDNSNVNFGVIVECNFKSIKPDGVCERKPNQKKPVLR